MVSEGSCHVLPKKVTRLKKKKKNENDSWSITKIIFIDLCNMTDRKESALLFLILYPNCTINICHCKFLCDLSLVKSTQNYFATIGAVSPISKVTLTHKVILSKAISSPVRTHICTFSALLAKARYACSGNCTMAKVWPAIFLDTTPKGVACKVLTSSWIHYSERNLRRLHGKCLPVTEPMSSIDHRAWPPLGSGLKRW